MTNAARALAVIFGLMTFGQNFVSEQSEAQTLGTGLLAVTFAVLSLGRLDDGRG